MQIEQIINMLLLKLSLNHKVFYLEQRNCKEGKVYKSYKVKIDKEQIKEFKNKQQVILYLKDRK